MLESPRSDGVRAYPETLFGFPPECAFSFSGIPTYASEKQQLAELAGYVSRVFVPIRRPANEKENDS